MTRLASSATAPGAMRVPRGRLAVGLLLAFTLALRVYGIGYENLWTDEAYTLRVASQGALDIIRNYHPHCPFGVCDQAPLSDLVFHFSVSPSEGLFRLPAAVAGALGVVALLAVARALVPDAVAWLAAALLALAPLHVWYSQEARWYTLWSLFVTLSYAMLVRALTGGRWQAWLAYALAIVAGAYSFIFTYLVIACQGLSVLVAPPGARRLRAFVVVQMGVVLATLPVLLTTLTNLGNETGTTRPTLLAALPYTGFAYSVGFSLGPSLTELHALESWAQILLEHPIVVVVAAIVAPLLALGTRELLRDRLASAILLPWAFGLPLLVFLVGLVSHVVYQVRYSFASVPAFWVVLAAGVVAVRPGAPRNAALGALLGCLALSLVGFFTDPRYDREDVRGALASVRASDAPQGLVLVVGQEGEAPTYYAQRLGARIHQGCEPGGERATLWVLAVRDWEHAGPACLAQLAPRYALVAQQQFPGVILSRLAPAAGVP